ncbi:MULTISPECIES: hypothetical protein [Nostoc]|nr:MULTISPECIES: hypothetical protein [Nostoc]MBD2679164.1 hypothetical protein [Nostoc sp. FACHB-857]
MRKKVFYNSSVVMQQQIFNSSWRGLIGECGDEKDGIWKKCLEKIVKINLSSLLLSDQNIAAFADIGIKYFA